MNGGGVVYVTDNQNSRVEAFQQTLVGVPASRATAQLSLAAIVPMPVTGGASIHFDLPVAARTTLGIYDLRGRLVRVAWAGSVLEGGPHEWEWDGRDGGGVALAPGVYVVVLESGSVRATRKVVMTN